MTAPANFLPHFIRQWERHRLYAVKLFHGMIKILRVAIFAQICYDEAQVTRGHYPFHGFV